MSTEEHYDGRDGEVHGLLATAFDGGGMPVLNLVPGAVDGYRRHRRRARVLGTAGGALALAGAVTAGTALAGTGTSGGTTTVGAAQGSSEPGRAAGKATAPEKDPLCDGRYHRFGARPGDHIYSADSAALERVCARDVAALRAAIPGATVVPQRETFAQALARHDAQPGEQLPPGADRQTPLLSPGEYIIKAGGKDTLLNLVFADKMGWGFNGCEVGKCAPNMRMADGTPATESTAEPGSGVGALSVGRDAEHWVFAMALIPNAKVNQSLPYDFGKLVRSQPFAAAVAADVRDLTRLG